MLLVFDWRVAELVPLGSEQMGWKWLGDRHGGYLGTDLGTKYSAVSLVLSAINGPRDQNCATSHSRGRTLVFGQSQDRGPGPQHQGQRLARSSMLL